MIQPEIEQDTSKSTLDNSGLMVNIYKPREETNIHVKKPVDVILLCIRLDDLFRVEDKQIIIKLAKKFGKEFLKKTIVILTMANKVKPMGALKHQYSDHQYLKTVRDEFKAVIIDVFKKQKLTLPSQLSHRFVL